MFSPQNVIKIHKKTKERKIHNVQIGGADRGREGER